MQTYPNISVCMYISMSTRESHTEKQIHILITAYTSTRHTHTQVYTDIFKCVCTNIYIYMQIKKI